MSLSSSAEEEAMEERRYGAVVEKEEEKRNQARSRAPVKGSREIVGRFPYRRDIAGKIARTFKVTRVSRGFKRLSRLTLNPEQFQLPARRVASRGVGWLE